jgi:predicted phosphodiesterase
MLKKILILSDLHIGHPLNNFNIMLQGFNHIIPELSDTDLVVITGDYFHTSLNLNHIETHNAFTLLSKLMQLADQYKFKIRILQGTYSHDRDQINRLLPLLTGWNVDLLYIDSLYVEYIDNHSFLYLPDNPLYQNMQNLITELQIHNISKNNQIDFIMIHGLFDIHKYHTNLPCYNLDFLSSICKYWICAGHIHTHQVWNKYISVGSFTRFKHGEEEHKGYLILNNINNQWIPKFKINPYTIKFLSFILDQSDPDLIMHEYQEILKKHFNIHEEAYIRIILQDINQAKNLQAYTSTTYPKLHFSYKTIKRTQFQNTFNLCTDQAIAQDLSNRDQLLKHMNTYFNSLNISISFDLKKYIEDLHNAITTKHKYEYDKNG